eukprot:CAMPEP_0174245326 /NCGR_PEP_ID=MMETSP0417-20130205/38434_1 /TAXON_ID=242541 /ORGANISM="Mayorella sp, Strain BSH-02190019" /LENGTH=61 /DNA_ID=CAMNT_0015325091 /DNA_START=29 /DNA_END=214 /DNA_ORIENTATION=-
MYAQQQQQKHTYGHHLATSAPVAGHSYAGWSADASSQSATPELARISTDLKTLLRIPVSRA